MLEVEYKILCKIWFYKY